MQQMSSGDDDDSSSEDEMALLTQPLPRDDNEEDGAHTAAADWTSPRPRTTTTSVHLSTEPQQPQPQSPLPIPGQNQRRQHRPVPSEPPASSPSTSQPQPPWFDAELSASMTDESLDNNSKPSCSSRSKTICKPSTPPSTAGLPPPQVDSTTPGTAAESSSSSDDDDEYERAKPQLLTLSERRLHNVQRNHGLLQRLGLAHGMAPPKQRHHNDDAKTQTKRRKLEPPTGADDADNAADPSQHQFLLPGALLRWNENKMAMPDDWVSMLETRYPARHAQIRALAALLSSSSSAPPTIIMVTGGHGTGKTSVVRDVVAAVAEYPAYIDCATLDAPTIEELVLSVYRQIEAQVTATTANRKTAPNELERGLFLSGGSSDNPIAKTTTKTTKTKRSVAAPASQPQNWAAVSQLGLALERLLRPPQQLQQSNHDGDNHHCRRRCRSAILVLDHAERLLRLPGSTKHNPLSERVNFLAQLLLLPRRCPNLSIVVITQSVLLEHTCLNHMSSQGTITSHIAPIRVHFPSYRGKNTIQTILYQDRMRCLITGENPANHGTHTGNAFADKVYHSFIGTLVQALQDLTTDIKEFLRLGRILWPQYTSLVRPTNIRQTLDHVQRSKHRNLGTTTSKTGIDKAALERDVLSYLDQKIFPYVRYAIEHGLGNLLFHLPTDIPETKPGSVVEESTATSNIPVLTRYLLLAAYVCQVNRAERDQQLFTIQTNGKSRRRHNNNNSVSRNAQEESALGCTTGDSAARSGSSLRARTYPVERLYSLYVSMVSLNHAADDHDDAESVRSLGNIYFLDAVAHLQSLGVLHEFPKRSPNDMIRLSQRSLWSSITRDEAEQVAQSVEFPLDRYIL